MKPVVSRNEKSINCLEDVVCREDEDQWHQKLFSHRCQRHRVPETTHTYCGPQRCWKNCEFFGFYQELAKRNHNKVTFFCRYFYYFVVPVRDSYNFLTQLCFNSHLPKICLQEYSGTSHKRSPLMSGLGEVVAIVLNLMEEPVRILIRWSLKGAVSPIVPSAPKCSSHHFTFH